MNRLFCSLALAVLVATPAAGQSPPSSAQQPVPVQQPPVQQAPAPMQQPPFRATTLVVEVDAVVTDGKGHFVTGLTANDFEVLEDGTPQGIQQIYLVTGKSVERPTGSLAEPGPERPAELPAPPSAAPQRVFVLFFDEEHIELGAFKRLRDAAVSFLTTEFAEGDIGGVVIGGKMAGNQLTTNRELLLGAVRAAKPNPNKTSRRLERLEWPRFSSDAEAVQIALFQNREVIGQVVRRAMADDPSLTVDPTPDVMEKARRIVNELRPAAANTVRTVQALVSGLGRIPGRKTLVLLTEGFFVEESYGDLRQIIGAAARSNVRIYSIDARGLNIHEESDNLRQLSVMDAQGSLPLEAYNTIEDGPNTLAVDTGGYVVRRTNDFKAGLAEIARDTSTYYVIAYAPTKAGDGSFRRITVRVKRPGLMVRFRRGYLSTAPAAHTPAAAPTGENARPPAVPGAAARGAPEPTGTKVDAAAGEKTVAAPARKDAAPEDRGKVPSGMAPALTLRPDSNDRVRELASRDPAAEGGTNLASQGWERYQKGDLEGAAELLTRAAADLNARPWVHYVLGYSEFGLGHPDIAAQEWEKVRGAAPDFLPVYLDLADAYGQVENFSLAIRILEAAEAKWPSDVDVLNAMGTIQVRRGALDAALDTFRKATNANPDDALAYFNLGRTYQLRYFKTRRYSQTEGRWLANAADIKNAIASYQQYLKLGGPYEAEAREAMNNLQWVK